MNKYQAVRDLNGSVVSSLLKKIGMGRTGDWARTEMLQKPGEVNPRIVELEQRVRNVATTKKLTVHDKAVGEYMKKPDIDNERRKKEAKMTVRENAEFQPPVVYPQGMGNPVAPTADGKVGSGDEFMQVGDKQKKRTEFVPFSRFVEPFNKIK